MYLITLEEAKKHLNIESYNNEDDSYISMLIDASFVAIRNRCNNLTWIDSSAVTYGDMSFADLSVSGTTIPLPIKQAVLLMVGNLYANREPVSFGSPVNIPFTLQFLIDPYINYEGTVSTTTTTLI